MVFGWRALRPPRVVFVLGFLSLINSLTRHFRQKNLINVVGDTSGQKTRSTSLVNYNRDYKTTTHAPRHWGLLLEGGGGLGRQAVGKQQKLPAVGAHTVRCSLTDTVIVLSSA